jgi:hypothetical protein
VAAGKKSIAIRNARKKELKYFVPMPEDSQSNDGNNNQCKLNKERKSKKIHNLKSAVWNKNKKTH